MGISVRHMSKAVGNQRVKLRGVRRYRYGDRTYTYHRASGAPLPDLPETHPDFIAAFKRAEVDHKNRMACCDQVLKASPPKPVAHSVPITPQAIIMTYHQAISWLFGAAPGHTVYYHVGHAANDRTRDQDTDFKVRYFHLLGEFEAVNLRQARVAEDHTYYFAIRSENSLRYLPQNVLTGSVTPLEYQAIDALLHRPGDLSVARCLRDYLNISADEASEMRNDFIRRGWLTNGRPPEPTRLGLSVVA